jgi:hypothetical protein
MPVRRAGFHIVSKIILDQRAPTVIQKLNRTESVHGH